VARADSEDSEDSEDPNPEDPSRSREQPPRGDDARRDDRTARRPGAAGGEREGGDRPQRLRGGGDPNGRGGLGGLWPLVDDGEDSEREVAPIAGEDFRDWSDRLRDVEEMIDDPDLRAEAARIRDRARGIRVDVKRHAKEPNWDLVRISVAEPLNELRRRVSDELLRRESEDALVPIDGDPVPEEYAERVRKYYERLGSGK
jgi:hypothetical protein